MKVVITGGMGFIGARLGRALCDQGHLTDASGQETPIDELLYLIQSMCRVYLVNVRVISKSSVL